MTGEGNNVLRLAVAESDDQDLAQWALASGAALTNDLADSDAFLVDEATEERLIDWIRSGRRTVIDPALNPESLKWLFDLGIGETPMCCACLSTRTAYEIDAIRLLEAADVTSIETEDGENLIEIGVREAMSNAIVHGNLEISSDLRGSFETWDQYSSLIEERLADDAYWRRPVALVAVTSGSELRIAVHDSGSGFDFSESEGRAKDLQHGRGILLIRSSCAKATWSRGGRTVTLSHTARECG